MLNVWWCVSQSISQLYGNLSEDLTCCLLGCILCCCDALTLSSAVHICVLPTVSICFPSNTTRTSLWSWPCPSSCLNQTWTVGGSQEGAAMYHSCLEGLFCCSAWTTCCVCASFFAAVTLVKVRKCHTVHLSSPYNTSGWMCSDLNLVEVLWKSVIRCAVLILRWVIQTCPHESHL